MFMFMFKKSTKVTNVLGRLTLLSSFFIAANAFAAIQVLGGKSDISLSISDHYQQSSQVYNSNLAKNDLLYINVGTASDDEIEKAGSHIIQGDIVIIDLRKIPDEGGRFDISQSLIGLGSNSPVIVTGTYQGEKIINPILTDISDQYGQLINKPAAELESLKKSLIHALDRLGFAGE